MRRVLSFLKWATRTQRGGKKRRDFSRTFPGKRMLHLEPLETRRLLSVTYTVTNTDSVSDPGSLAYEVAQANADISGQPITVNFDSGFFATPKTITLNATLDLNNSMSGTSIAIVGPAAGLTIDGGGNNAVFTVESGTTASFSGLTIVNAATGIDIEGGSATISGNSITTTSGTGILVNGTTASATITGNTISGNATGITSKAARPPLATGRPPMPTPSTATQPA